MDYYRLIELEMIKEKKLQQYKKLQREIRYNNLMNTYKKELTIILGDKLTTASLETLEITVRLRILNNQ